MKDVSAFTLLSSIAGPSRDDASATRLILLSAHISLRPPLPPPQTTQV